MSQPDDPTLPASAPPRWLVVYPILAVTAIVLARHRRLLPLAALFVAIPTIVTGLLVAAFAISVALYGF